MAGSLLDTGLDCQFLCLIDTFLSKKSSCILHLAQKPLTSVYFLHNLKKRRTDSSLIKARKTISYLLFFFELNLF